MVLDPSANKSLFNVCAPYVSASNTNFRLWQSTLAIIIKDVTNSDAKDIVKEYAVLAILPYM